jgi:hypothetical protein
MGKNRIVTAEGQVILLLGKQKVIEYYEEEFVFPADMPLSTARQTLHNQLMTERLRKTYDNFIRWRTCQVSEGAETDKEVEDAEVVSLLVEAAELGCVPESLDRYGKPESKAKALKESIKSAKERKAATTRKRKKDAEDDGEYVD